MTRCETSFIHRGPSLDGEGEWIASCELPEGHDGPHALVECICYPGECDQNMCEPACPRCRG